MNEKNIIGFVATEKKINRFNHTLVKNVHDRYFYLVYKKAVFKSYGQTIERKPDNEAGESINEDALKTALVYHATIIFIYPIHLRTIKAEDFAKIAYKNEAIRATHEGEVTVSVPLSALQEFKRDTL
jgi:hypothetical protein